MDDEGFSWHFATFQGLNSSSLKLLSHSYTEKLLHLLKSITVKALYISIKNLAEVLYKEINTYNEQAVGQGLDWEGNGSTIYDTS